MLILIVPTIVVVILLIISFLINHFRDSYSNVPEELKYTAIILAILIACSAFPAFLVNLCAESSDATYRTKYYSLVYQLENYAYDNTIEYNLLNLMNDIYDYNSHVESGRILSKNPWIGVYYPQDWDNLPLIRLEDYK